MKNSFSKSVYASVLLAALLVAPAAWAKDTLVMGVHPYKPTVALFKMFKPIADNISQKIGKPVELQFAKSYEETAEKVGSGQFDFSFFGPTTYAKFGPKYHMKPIVQILNSGKPTFYGVIVVKKGSSIKTVHDIKGRSVAFGDRNSTLTHVVPLYMLMNEGIHLGDLKSYSFLGNHDNLALNVIQGTYDAAGLMPDIAEKYMGQGLEVIAKSPELPEHVFAANKSMDPATFKNIQDAFLSMDVTLLKNIKESVTGVQKVHDKDFDILRKILDKVEKDLDK